MRLFNRAGVHVMYMFSAVQYVFCCLSYYGKLDRSGAVDGKQAPRRPPPGPWLPHARIRDCTRRRSAAPKIRPCLSTPHAADLAMPTGPPPPPTTPSKPEYLSPNVEGLSTSHPALLIAAIIAAILLVTWRCGSIQENKLSSMLRHEHLLEAESDNDDDIVEAQQDDSIGDEIIEATIPCSASSQAPAVGTAAMIGQTAAAPSYAAPEGTPDSATPDTGGLEQLRHTHDVTRAAVCRQIGAQMPRRCLAHAACHAAGEARVRQLSTSHPCWANQVRALHTSAVVGAARTRVSPARCHSPRVNEPTAVPITSAGLVPTTGQAAARTPASVIVPDGGTFDLEGHPVRAPIPQALSPVKTRSRALPMATSLPPPVNGPSCSLSLPLSESCSASGCCSVDTNARDSSTSFAATKAAAARQRLYPVSSQSPTVRTYAAILADGVKMRRTSWW